MSKKYWLDGRVVMQRPAKPFTPVRFRLQPPKIMKIGIIGYGFVGNALASSFNDSVDYRIVDPKKNTTISSLVEFSPEIVFICVPTPMNDDGSQDDSILKDVFKEINDNKIKATIVIKSTILPSFFENIKSNNIVYNPEFLTEANAEQDFINSDFMILGGIDQIAIDKIENFYKKHTLCLSKKYAKTDFITASFLKYAINNYLAHKVVFLINSSICFKNQVLINLGLNY